MDTTLFETIEKRKSCRSYGAAELEHEKLIALEEFITSLDLPFWGNRPRFAVLEITPPGQGRMLAVMVR